MKYIFVVVFGFMLCRFTPDFYGYSHYLASRMSNPSVIYKAQLNDEKRTVVLVDDYRFNLSLIPCLAHHTIWCIS